MGGRRSSGAERLLTDLGRSTSWCGAALLGLGIIFGWVEFIAGGLFVAVLVGVAAAWTARLPKHHLDLVVETPGVHIGEPAHVDVTVTNRRRRATRATRVEVLVGARRTSVSVPALGGGLSAVRSVVVATRRRGVIAVGPAFLVRTDPLGLLQRERRVGVPTSLVVYPAITPLDRVDRTVFDDLAEASARRLSAGGGEFHLLRHYVAGDDPRHIHWRSTAKAGQWVVKQFVDVLQQRVDVSMDPRLSSYGSEREFEVALSMMASLALLRMRHRLDVSVRFGEKRLPTGATRPFLESCATLTPQNEHWPHPAEVDHGTAPPLPVMISGSRFRVGEAVHRSHDSVGPADLGGRLLIRACERTVDLPSGERDARDRSVSNLVIVDVATLDRFEAALLVAVGR